MLTRRSLIKGAGTVGMLGAVSMGLAACGGAQGGSSASASASASAQAQSPSSSAPSASASSASKTTPALGNSVVVFFSRAGENFEVGVVDEGNTAKVAHSIAGKVVSNVFELVPMEEYPFGYDDCVAQAQQEQDEGARPALLDDFANFDSYDTIYLGYPIWHSDMPMAVYTFIESKDWSGKNVMPFCTHGDSGLNGTVEKIKQLCAGATVKEGLAIKGSVAQEMGSDADAAINAWLAKVRS